MVLLLVAGALILIDICVLPLSGVYTIACILISECHCEHNRHEIIMVYIRISLKQVQGMCMYIHNGI